MSTTVRETFERGTDTFNAHDLDGFAAVLADAIQVAAIQRDLEKPAHDILQLSV